MESTGRSRFRRSIASSWLQPANINVASRIAARGIYSSRAAGGLHADGDLRSVGDSPKMTCGSFTPTISWSDCQMHARIAFPLHFCTQRLRALTAAMTRDGRPQARGFDFYCANAITVLRAGCTLPTDAMKLWYAVEHHLGQEVLLSDQTKKNQDRLIDAFHILGIEMP